jgi:hypothetical protein
VGGGEEELESAARVKGCSEDAARVQRGCSEGAESHDWSVRGGGGTSAGWGNNMSIEPGKDLLHLQFSNREAFVRPPGATNGSCF